MISAEDVSILTPTFRRHAQLRRMLTALAGQSVQVGQIVIADGGRDATDLVAEYAGKLPVEWLDCEVRGQIAQRNLGLTRIRAACRVVLYLDDDIVLAPDCIAQLLAFWNAQEREPAGVGLNITNMPQQPDGLFRRLFLMGTRPMGRVLVSGYNTPVTGVAHNLDSQWLTGGATAWRRDVLEAYLNAPVQTSWAVGEDLMFSYPISKQERLAVCAAALCTHEDEAPAMTFAGGRFRAYRGVVSRYVFVRAHPELRQLAFFWMIFGQLLGRLVRGISGRRSEWGFLVGTVEALRDCVVNARRSEVSDMLADRAH